MQRNTCTMMQKSEYINRSIILKVGEEAIDILVVLNVVRYFKERANSNEKMEEQRTIDVTN